MSRTISDKIRLIIDANPNKALAQLKRFNAGLRRVAIGAQQVQMALASVGFVAGGAFAFIAKEVVNFDDAMRSVKSKMDRGLSAEKFEELKNKAKNLGKNTSYTATQVAGLMKALAQSGKTADEILGMSEAMVAFGRASEMESLQQSSDTLVKMLTMFDKGASDAEHFSDVLIFGARSATTTVEELSEGLRMLGPIMASLGGGSFEETVATLAVLAGGGEAGGRGGRGARASVLKSLTSDAVELYKKYNIELEDGEGTMKTMVQIQQEMNQALKGEKSEVVKIGALQVANGRIGLNAALNAGKQAEEIKEMTLRMKALVDETKIANMILEGGVGGSLRRLRSALDGLVQAMGEDLIVNLALLSDTLRNGVIDPLIEFIEKTQNFASKIGLVGAAAAAGSLAAGLTAIASIVAANVISAFIGLVAITTKFAKSVVTGAMFLIKRFPQAALLVGAVAFAFTALDRATRSSTRSVRKLVDPLELLDGAINGIIDSLVLGDWEGATNIMEKAWAVAIAAMKVEWERFVADVKFQSGNITGWVGAVDEVISGPSIAAKTEAGRKAVGRLVDMANKKLPNKFKVLKEGGLFEGDAAGALPDFVDHQFPAAMADALGGQKKANELFKQLRREAMEDRKSISERFAYDAGQVKAEEELIKKREELLEASKNSAAAKAAEIAKSKELIAETLENAQAEAQLRYEKLKTKEAEEALAAATMKAERARKIANDEGRAARWKGRLDNFTKGMTAAMNRTAFVAEVVGPRVWAAYFHNAATGTRKFKRDMNEVKDVVKEISFGKLGSFDIGTAQAELNAKLNDTAARQLDAQLRIAKSNDEINEVLKRNGPSLRVGS
tara:strand:+ start:3181 stop:5712 length:2532 start_codon:yes stop_codon:yes gene_type:complete